MGVDQPSEPQNRKIKREENEEADLTTKLALDNEPLTNAAIATAPLIADCAKRFHE